MVVVVVVVFMELDDVMVAKVMMVLMKVVMVVVRIRWQRDDVTAGPCRTLVFSWTSSVHFTLIPTL